MKSIKLCLAVSLIAAPSWSLPGHAQGVAKAGYKLVCVRRDKSNRCIETVKQAAIGEAVVEGAKGAKKKVVEKVKKEARCTNTTDPNSHANSTPAVRKC